MKSVQLINIVLLETKIYKNTYFSYLSENFKCLEFLWINEKDINFSNIFVSFIFSKILLRYRKLIESESHSNEPPKKTIRNKHKQIINKCMSPYNIPQHHPLRTTHTPQKRAKFKYREEKPPLFRKVFPQTHGRVGVEPSRGGRLAFFWNYWKLWMAGFPLGSSVYLADAPPGRPEYK